MKNPFFILILLFATTYVFSQPSVINSAKIMMELINKGHAFTEYQFDFSPDGDFFVNGTSDGLVKISNIASNNIIHTYPAHNEKLTICVKYSPDGKVIASGGKDGSLFIFNESKNLKFQVKRAHKKAIMTLCFSSDGETIYTGSRDNTIGIWNLEGKELGRIRDVKGNIKSLIINKQKNELIAGTSNLSKGIRIFDLQKMTEARIVEIDNVEQLDYNPINGLLAVVSLNKDIYLVDMNRYYIVDTLKSHSKYATDATFTAKGDILVSGSNDRTIKIWDIPNRRLIKSLEPENIKGIENIALSSDGNRLATYDYVMSTITIFDISLTINEFRNKTIENPQIKIPDLTTSSEDTVYTLVEEMPVFEGCEEGSSAEKQQCTQQAIFEFLSINLKYPKAARDAGITGVVYVNFVINEKGEVVNPKILRGIGGGCDEESLRVVSEFPDFIPGFQRGKAVRVSYNLPIRYVIRNKRKRSK